MISTKVIPFDEDRLSKIPAIPEGVILCPSSDRRAHIRFSD